MLIQKQKEKKAALSKLLIITPTKILKMNKNNNKVENKIKETKRKQLNGVN